VETIIQADVQVFFTQIAVDKPEATGQQANHQQAAALDRGRARRGARNRDPG
jgi:hypothetical protein